MRRAIFLGTVTALILTGYFTACTHKTDLTNATVTVSFSNQVLPIVESNCNMSGCHGADGRRRKLTDYKTITAQVIPYNAKGSALYQNIIGSAGATRMPPSGNWLTEDQTKLIFLWIMQGAPNN